MLRSPGRALCPQGTTGIIRIARRTARTPTTNHRSGISAQRQPNEPTEPFEPVLQGVYGEWSITDKDVVEVWLYRISISVIAASVVGCSAYAAGIVGLDANTLALVGMGGLGAALQLIHVYVTPLKRMLQIFWGLGVVGYAWIASQAPNAVVLDFILDTPSQTLWVGPLGAALTGIAFKEGLCYGKAEAGALTFLIPALFLCHLFAVDERVPTVGYALDAAVCVSLAIFAARKYTQKLEDDIGDGSVFAFQRLSEEEQLKVLTRLEAERMGERVFRGTESKYLMKMSFLRLCFWVTLFLALRRGHAGSNSTTLAASGRRGSSTGKCTKVFSGKTRVTASPGCKGKYMKIRNACKDKKVYFETTKTMAPVEWRLHVKGGGDGMYSVAFEPAQKGCKGLYLNAKLPKPPADPSQWKAQRAEAYLSSKKTWFPMEVDGEDYEDFDSKNDCEPYILLVPGDRANRAFGISDKCDGFVVGQYEDGAMDGYVPFFQV